MNRINGLRILFRPRVIITALLFFTFLALNSFGQQKDSTLLAKSIPSMVFGKDRKITITLPAEYFSQPAKKFPVVYLFDAQSDALFAFTQATMRYLNGTNSLDPMILVGIPSERRQFEFTPLNQTKDPFEYNPNAKFWKNIKVGGADTLLLHLETEVFPYIEKHYRTLPVRLGVGHSLGATFVTYGLTQNKAIFDAIIAVSPNYAYDQEQMVTRVKQYINADNIPPTYFYLARGERSELLFNAGIEKVVSLINSKKPSAVDLRYAVLDVANHGNTVLEGFTKGFIAYHTSIYANADNIINYFTRLSAKAGYKLDAGQINQMAYDNFMTPDNYPQAIKIFAWGSKLYPNDYNLYDSRSEAEENSGNVYALISISDYDTQIAHWDSKYTYYRARPDQFDTTFVSLFTTPASPSYPAGHGTMAYTRAAVLSFLFPYDRDQFYDMAKEANHSRFVAGVHYKSDNIAGEALGRKVGEEVVKWAKGKTTAWK